MQHQEFALHDRIEDQHWWFRARREIMLTMLSRYVPVNENRLMLEIGCGTGGNLRFFSNFYSVFGTDTSADAVNYARARMAVEIQLGDFSQIEGDRWDRTEAVVLADVLEHVEDDAQFLGMLLDRMKRGSYLLLTVPAHPLLWSSHDIVLGHKRRYTPRSLRSLWTGRDVDELYFSPFGSILLPFIAIYRIFRRTHISGTSDLHLPSPWLNEMFYRLFLFDRLFMRFIRLPWGTSYLALLKRR